MIHNDGNLDQEYFTGVLTNISALQGLKQYHIYMYRTRMKIKCIPLFFENTTFLTVFLTFYERLRWVCHD